jgi:hypothetical protein
MKNILEYINEAKKYDGFSKEEIDELNQVLKDTVENPDFIKSLNKLRNSKNDNHNYPKLEYGQRYIVHFSHNPLANTEKISKTKDKLTPIEKEEDFYVLGIADKFGKLFLYGRWENATLKHNTFDKEVTNPKTGKKWKEESGWLLSIKDIENYKVYKGGSAYSRFYYAAERKNKDVWNLSCSLDIDLVYDFSFINDDVKKFVELIEKEAIEKAENERKAAERKAYWEMVEREYQDLGCANGWGKDKPEIVKQAEKDKDAEWHCYNLGRCYNEYVSDKYKIYFRVDSSD